LQKQLELVTNDNQLHVVTNALVTFWGISNSALSLLINEWKNATLGLSMDE
jgi:hypothetical protein